MAQRIKYTISESRLQSLVSECITEVLMEAKNDEGLGGWLGKMAGKIRNGVNNFRDDFNAQRNGQLYQNRNYDAYSANGVDQNARNFDKTMSQNYRSAAQRGASNAAPGSFKTPYGDSVGNGGNGGNQDLLAQIQKELADLTQQVQSIQQNSAKNTQQAQQTQQTSTDKQETQSTQAPEGQQEKTETNSANGTNQKQSIDQAAIKDAHAKTAGQNRKDYTKKEPAEQGQKQNQSSPLDNPLVQAARKKVGISESALRNMISETIKRHLSNLK